jgi:hypothetical protein
LLTAGGEAVRITDAGGSLINYWRIQGSPASGGVQLTAAGSDANVSALYSSRGTGSQAFFTNSFAQEQLRVSHTASAVNYVQVTGAATAGYPVISAQGSDSNAGLILQTKGSGYVRFSTGGGPNSDQLRVTHTANPVNYAQITGNIAGSAPVFSVAGSDTNIDLSLAAKGTGAIRNNVGNNVTWLMSGPTTTVARLMAGGQSILESRISVPSFMTFYTGSSADFANEGAPQFRVNHTTSAVNYVQVTGAATGNAPTIQAQGSDANVELRIVGKGTGGVALMDSAGLTAIRAVARATSGDTFLDVQRSLGFVNLIATSGVANSDISLTPKGTGKVRFGTYTASMSLTVQGYIEVKDAGGTVRRLAVVD